MPKKRIRRDLDFDHNVGSRGHVPDCSRTLLFYCSFSPSYCSSGKNISKKNFHKKKYLSDQNGFLQNKRKFDEF
ncbi:hypothetical protein CEXT_203701 [Caerostris extrusa]|uniref:Uncharacterized protein n=1 Tax=Caerostris extrusa TaxID=172846 RepID=A0AAV4Y1Q8_CAEEX|nr:hypothetical protein CEXT_203701 [Caerostris extrusa]